MFSLQGSYCANFHEVTAGTMSEYYIVICMQPETDPITMDKSKTCTDKLLNTYNFQSSITVPWCPLLNSNWIGVHIC